MSEAVVIGVGNRLRRDDGVGLAVIDRVRAKLPAGVRAFALEHVPPDLYERWAGAQRVVLVDAAASGAEVGSVRRFEPSQEPIPTDELRLSTHGFGVAQAVELARALGHLPPEVTVYAIEGGDFADGEGLSPAVEAAAAEVAERIHQELEAAHA